MKKFRNKFFNLLKTALYAAIILTALWLSATYLTGSNPKINMWIWYFAIILGYFTVSLIVILEVHSFKVNRFVFFLNISMILILFVGVLLNIFGLLGTWPAYINLAFGWSVIPSAIFSVILLFAACLNTES